MSDRRFALMLMLPAAIFLAVFVGWPLVKFVTDSFFEISPIAGGPREFVGFDNYATAFASEAFQNAAWRTVVYTVIVVTAEFVLGSRWRCSSPPSAAARTSSAPCSCTRS